jgi:hypothetical protein
MNAQRQPIAGQYLGALSVWNFGTQLSATVLQLAVQFRDLFVANFASKMQRLSSIPVSFARLF